MPLGYSHTSVACNTSFRQGGITRHEGPPGRTRPLSITPPPGTRPPRGSSPVAAGNHTVGGPPP